MNPADPLILILNAGSSSIKFVLYQAGDPLQRRFHGQVDRIGLSGTNLTVHGLSGKHQEEQNVPLSGNQSAPDLLIHWLEGDDEAIFRNGQPRFRTAGHIRNQF